MKVAQAQLNVANSLVAANQAQVKQFTAALQSAQIDLDHTNITAPVDGVVVSRNVDVGQTVAASLAAPTLFLIAQDLTKMQVDTNVSEADVGRVRVNQPATFTVDAYPGRTFTGSVTSIREAPINVQNVITYDAVIGVSNSDLKLFPGHDGEREDPGEPALECAEGAQCGAPLSPGVGGVAGREGHGCWQARRSAEKAVWVLDGKDNAAAGRRHHGREDGTFTEVTERGLEGGRPRDCRGAGEAAPAVGEPRFRRQLESAEARLLR